MSVRRPTEPREPRVTVRNASDPDQVKRGRETECAKAERERNEDHAVWSTRPGRAFTRRLLAQCGVYQLSMSSDPHWTAFNEGARNVGLELLARLTTQAPDLYLLMEREHAEQEAMTPRAPEESQDAQPTEDNS